MPRFRVPIEGDGLDRAWEALNRADIPTVGPSIHGRFTPEVRVGRRMARTGRNVAAIVAMETITIIWFFYCLLLVIYDKSILGDRHPVTYIVCFASLAWAMYLLRRLLLFSRLTAAIRYAIPTAIIAWNAVEDPGTLESLHRDLGASHGLPFGNGRDIRRLDRGDGHSCPHAERQRQARRSLIRRLSLRHNATGAARRRAA